MKKLDNVMKSLASKGESTLGSTSRKLGTQTPVNEPYFSDSKLNPSM